MLSSENIDYRKPKHEAEGVKMLHRVLSVLRTPGDGPVERVSCLPELC